MNFEQTASSIIKEYIQSGICIDNDYCPPYPRDDIERSKDSMIPSKLYHSFRENGKCDLDIYCYKDNKEWQKVKEYAFDSKDLLVLDWELTEVEPKFQDALEILSDAIDSETIQFVIIYTRVPNLSEVELNLLSFFGPYVENLSDLERKKSELQEYISTISEISDSNKFYEKAEVSLKELSISKNKEEIKTIKEAFVASIGDLYEEEKQNGHIIFNNFLKKAEVIYGLNTQDLLLFLGPWLSNKIPNTKRDKLYNIKKLDAANLFYSINNTVIMIFPNENSTSATEHIYADDVFNQFANVIYKNPHSFITLLSLEMKGIYRKKISILGKEMLNINEKAFFYQMDNYDSKEEFYNFLINSWNNEINNFSRENLPTLLETITEYRVINGLANIDIGKHHNELVKMGFLLSCSSEKNSEDKMIKFGDIFKWIEMGTGKEYYFLNITPHCDCLRPDKIKNNFHFIICRKEFPSIQSALHDAEKKHYTFISIDKPFVIEWDTKPFTMYIKDNLLKDNILITTYLGDEIKLSYFTTLKENFTQRLANHSFGYSMRIGIDHPHLKNS